MDRSERERERHRRYYLKNKKKAYAATRAWRKANPERVKEQNKRSYWRRKALGRAQFSHRIRAEAIARWKRMHGCSRCGWNDHSSHLHFHHTDPETKSFEIGGSKSTVALHLLIEEMKKCVILCGSCHTKISSGPRPPLPEKDEARVRTTLARFEAELGPPPN
jgi:hypothetical protein